MNNIISLQRVRKFVDDSVGSVLHKKQVLSLGNGIFAAMHSSRLNIATLGRTYAQNTDGCPKHGIKQMDRLVGNTSIDTGDVFYEHVRNIVAARKNIVVTMDWTEYDATDQSRIALNLLSRHGRATPLLWISVQKSKLKRRRTGYEKKVLRMLKQILSEDVVVTVLADRGFCNTQLFKFIHCTLKWEYVIRIRGNIQFFDAMANAYGRMLDTLRLIRGGPVRSFENVLLTGRKYALPLLVAVHGKDMKEPWYLASSLQQKDRVVALYGRRFTCEEQFRDEKDDRLGAGSKETKVGTLARRDMLTLIHSLATFLLIIIGEAGERLGYEKKLRANTSKQRTHSLYRQGKEYCRGVMKKYQAIFKQMMEMVLIEHRNCLDIYGVI